MANYKYMNIPKSTEVNKIYFQRNSSSLDYSKFLQIIFKTRQ